MAGNENQKKGGNMYQTHLDLDFYSDTHGNRWFTGHMEARYYKRKSWQGGGGCCCKDKADMKDTFFHYVRRFRDDKHYGYTDFQINIRDEDNGQEWTINGMTEVGRFREIYRQLSPRRGWRPNAGPFARQNAKKRRK